MDRDGILGQRVIYWGNIEEEAPDTWVKDCSGYIVAWRSDADYVDHAKGKEMVP